MWLWLRKQFEETSLGNSLEGKAMI